MLSGTDKLQKKKYIFPSNNSSSYYSCEKVNICQCFKIHATLSSNLALLLELLKSLIFKMPFSFLLQC